MLPLILLATLGQLPADEWRPFTLNPQYEVYGHMDAGVFRYSQSRLKDAPKNFGVFLPVLKAAKADDFEVSGTDEELGQLIAEAAASATPKAAAAVPKAAAPVPKESAQGPCPNRPKPDPLPIPPVPVAIDKDVQMILWIIASVVGFTLWLLFMGIFLLIAFLLFRWLYRKATEPHQPPTP